MTTGQRYVVKSVNPSGYAVLDTVREHYLGRMNETFILPSRQAAQELADEMTQHMLECLDLMSVDEAAEYMGVSQSRARAILADRGIQRVSGYPADEVRAIVRRQGARNDLPKTDDIVVLVFSGEPSRTWEPIETDKIPAGTPLSDVIIEAHNIGGEPGQTLRIERLDEDNVVVESFETQSR